MSQVSKGTIAARTILQGLSTLVMPILLSDSAKGYLEGALDRM